MQRQSLGSPAAKLQQIQANGEEDNSKKKTAGGGGEDEVVAISKPDKPSRPGCRRTDRSIHFIPILTLFCFLVLYLLSHDPSTTDLASAGGLKRLLDLKVSDEEEIGRYLGAGRGVISSEVSRSHRRLKQLERLRHQYYYHSRKNLRDAP